MSHLQPATDSRASRLQAVGGALMAGFLFGYPVDYGQIFLIKWFYPFFVLAVSPLFLWRLSGWTQGFGFGMLQIFRLLVLLNLLGVKNFYFERASTFGSLQWSWNLAIGLVVLTLILSVFQTYVYRPERKVLPLALDLILPALWLPVLAVWFYRYLRLPPSPAGHDFDHLIPFPEWYLPIAVIISIVFFFTPFFDWKIIFKLRPEKPQQIMLGLALELALIFALFGGFRSLYWLTDIGYSNVYREYSGDFLYSLIEFFKWKGIFFMLMAEASYCAMPLKSTAIRRGLLGLLAAMVVFAVAIHYPVFYRPEGFPDPQTQTDNDILVSYPREWRVSIPFDHRKKVNEDLVDNCFPIPFYFYLNPVTLDERRYCILDGETTRKSLQEMIYDPSLNMNPAAMQSYSTALRMVSPIDFIRYAKFNGIYVGAWTFTQLPPEPAFLEALEATEHNPLRLISPAACNYALAFHHFGDEQRAELYLAICGPARYQKTFNELYLSQSKITGRIIQLPWPRDRYRMEFALTDCCGCNESSTVIKPDGSFELAGVKVGKWKGKIVVHGNPGRDLGLKVTHLQAIGGREEIEVNGLDPVDLGEIGIVVVPVQGPPTPATTKP